MSGWVRVRAPATTANLGPGFDTLGLALGWHDTVWCAIAPTGVEVRVWGSGADGVPRDESNLVACAFHAACEAAGRACSGLRVALELHVPVGRGLGSSAAAVAAGAVAANALLGGPLSLERLVEVAAEVEGHPDNVAPAILGGFCVAGSRLARPSGGGDPGSAAEGARGGVWSIRLDPPRDVAAVAAIPDTPLPTRLAREVLPRQVPFADAVANVQRASLMVAAMATGRLDALADATSDRLHEQYRARLVPALHPCLRAARSAGALGAFLSGAGPTVLALVPDHGPVCHAVVRAMHEALAVHGGGRVQALRLSPQGATVTTSPPPPAPPGHAG